MRSWYQCVYRDLGMSMCARRWFLFQQYKVAIVVRVERVVLVVLVAHGG